MPIKERRPEAYQGNGAYIFVSYRRNDSASMEKIVRCLKRNGYNVWYDEGLIPANEWDEVIAQRVLDCSFFIALISKNYMQSRNCREELRFAWKNERPCLLIYLEADATLSPGFSMHFSGEQHLCLWDYNSVEEMLQRATREPSFEQCRDDVQPTSEKDSSVTTPEAHSETEFLPNLPQDAPSRSSARDVLVPSNENLATKPTSAPTAKELQTPEYSPVEDFEYKISQKGVTITRYNGKGDAIVIPEDIDHKPVTEIGANAFEYCKSLRTVAISEKVTTIGDWAFHGCTNLTSVTIPPSVITIENFAFGGCSSLPFIYVPLSVTDIGDWAFLDCSGLISVVLPFSVTSIGDFAFYGCNSLCDIYFFGLKAQWKAIQIGDNNSILNKAAIHCSDGLLRLRR